MSAARGALLTMQVVESLPTLREHVAGFRNEGARVAFVPTMGNLHAGHLALVEHARSLAERVVVSIYVNPTQFGANEDFGNYPRTLERDCQQLAKAGADLVYTPNDVTMYPLGIENATHVSVPGVSNRLEGKHRPGHFDGVATVVARLFLMVAPDVAVFGRKDYQQVAVIEHMVRDLSLPVAVQSAPTVREADGLAMSSRNQYLSESDRVTAPLLYREISRIATALEGGARDYKALRGEAVATLQDAGFLCDYVAIRNPDTLKKSKKDDTRWVVLAAALLGRARLIDNVSAG